jgi:hypothetical protein
LPEYGFIHVEEREASQLIEGKKGQYGENQQEDAEEPGIFTSRIQSLVLWLRSPQIE